MSGPRTSQPTRLVTVGLLALITFIAFDTLGVATAMPAVAGDLDAGAGYALAFALFLTGSLLGQTSAGGWSDSRGAREPSAAGLVLFVTGTIGCALAPTYPVFLAGRVVSGVGVGLLVVVIYVLIADVYAEQHRPRVFGWLSAAWLLPGLIGPLIAGWLAAQVTWRAVFWLIVPFAVAGGVLLSGPVLRLPSPRPDRRLGARSAAARGTVLAVAASGLQWAVQTGGPWPVRVLVGLGGVIAIGVTLPRLVPAGTLTGRPGLPAVIAFKGAIGGAYFGAEAYIPLAMHTHRGMSLTEAGLALSTASVGWAFGAWWQGRAARARPALLSLGAVLVLVGVILLPVTLLESVTPWVVVAIWAFAAMGMGFAMSTTSVLMLAMSAPDEQGRNASALQVSDALGSATGVAIAGAVYAALHTRAASDPSVFAVIWVGQAVLAVLAVWLGRRHAVPAPTTGDDAVRLPDS